MKPLQTEHETITSKTANLKSDLLDLLARAEALTADISDNELELEQIRSLFRP